MRDSSGEFNPLSFTRKLPVCQKCGGKVCRSYCTGKTDDGVSCLSPCWGKKEHFDLNCQECHYEFYQKTRPAPRSEGPKEKQS